jgi:hypothetical protein
LFQFPDLGARKVVVDFSGGNPGSEIRVVLRRQVDWLIGLSWQQVNCFVDRRDGRFIGHQVHGLFAQRLHALAFGYMKISTTMPICGAIRCWRCQRTGSMLWSSDW